MKRISTIAAVVLVISVLLSACSTPAAVTTPDAATGQTSQAPTEQATQATTSTEATAASTQPAKQKPVIVIAIDSDIDHIDYQQSRSLAAYDATGNMYSTLVRQKGEVNDKGVWIGTNDYEGELAESWDISDDGQTWTFHLRKGLKFADGSPITAKDVKWSLDRGRNGPGQNFTTFKFLGVTDVPSQIEAVDDNTLVIHGKDVTSLALTTLTFQTLAISSEISAQPSVTKDDPYANAYYHDKSNPSGPYIMTSAKTGEEYVFEPNPNYWRGQDYYQNSKVILRVVPEAATREQLLLNGDVDIAEGVPFKDVDKLKQNDQISIFQIDQPRVYHAGFNVQEKPFNDVRVRKAMSMAIDYQAIVDNVLYGYGKMARSPIGIGMPTHSNDYFPYTTPDIEGAKKLLADAGYPNGFTTDLLVPQEDSMRMDAATWIQADLSKIGVTVNINAKPSAAFNDLLNSHKTPFYMMEWYSWGNHPTYQLFWNFGCKEWTNYSMYCNDDFQANLEKMITAKTPTELEELSKIGQQKIMEDAPWIVLFQPDWVLATRKGVTGLSFYNDLHMHFASLTKSN